MENEVYRTGMVLHIEPVADILSTTIDRKGLAMAYIVDEQRDELLRELVRAVVIRAVGHDGRQAVCIVIGTDEMVRRGLRGAVWTMRVVLRRFSEEHVAVGLVAFGRRYGLERWFDAIGTVHGQGAIDFVGADVVETAWDACRHDVVELFPVELGGLEEGEGAHYVGAGECEGILDGTVDMGLGGEVDDAVHMFLLHQGVEGVEVTDVHLHEPVVRVVLDVPEVGEVAGVGQLIYVNYLIVRVFVHEQPDYMGAYESSSTGYYNGTFHFTRFMRYCPYWFLIIGWASSRTRSAVIQPLT